MSKISSSSYWDLIYPSVTVHSSASATITVAGKSFTSDVSGNTQHSMPWGTFSISDSVSGQSYERTIDRNTTDVYVMPEGALYWYGNVFDSEFFMKYGTMYNANYNNYLNISTNYFKLSSLNGNGSDIFVGLAKNLSSNSSKKMKIKTSSRTLVVVNR